MTQTTVAEFVQAIKEDLTLITKLAAAVDIEAYYKIAKEHGYHFTDEELRSEVCERSMEELAMMINPGMTPRRHLNGK